MKSFARISVAILGSLVFGVTASETGGQVVIERYDERPVTSTDLGSDVGSDAGLMGDAGQRVGARDVGVEIVRDRQGWGREASGQLSRSGDVRGAVASILFERVESCARELPSPGELDARIDFESEGSRPAFVARSIQVDPRAFVDERLLRSTRVAIEGGALLRLDPEREEFEACVAVVDVPQELAGAADEPQCYSARFVMRVDGLSTDTAQWASARCAAKEPRARPDDQ